MDNLPQEIQDKLDAYIERIKVIKWFKPSPNLDYHKIDTQINFALKCFGVEASIEYRKLKMVSDWGAARDAAWGAARDAAWGAAWDAAWGAARDAARDAAWGAARDASWDAARGAAEIIVSDLPYFAKKYPDGAFLQIVPLWEAGLCPIGVIDGKFIVYIPEN